MPLPDANKRSPRVYTNLQNLDLSTVTFSNIETTGDPIAIEEANEDELRRLVLVNLARLVCAGEWNGLLTAGGGGTGSPKFPAADMLSGYNDWAITNMPPYGSHTSTNTSTSLNHVYQFFWPFYAPRSGTVDELAIRQGSVTPGSTEYMWVAIYDSDDDNMPDQVLGYATYDLTVGGTQADSSLSADPVLEQGELYYVAFNRSATTSATFYTWAGVGALWGPNTAISGDKNVMTDVQTVQDAPAAAPAASTMRTYGLGSMLQVRMRIPDA